MGEVAKDLCKVQYSHSLTSFPKKFNVFRLQKNPSLLEFHRDMEGTEVNRACHTFKWHSPSLLAMPHPYPPPPNCLAVRNFADDPPGPPFFSILQHPPFLCPGPRPAFFLYCWHFHPLGVLLMSCSAIASAPSSISPPPPHPGLSFATITFLFASHCAKD